MSLLFKLAEEAKVAEKIEAMFAGEHLNNTEDRAVLHVALRSAKTDTYYDRGVNVVPDVHKVLDKIRIFSEAVRNGQYRGVTGKPLTDVVAVGIGGSFLGPLFVHTALETDIAGQVQAAGRTLSFLANVDPEDVSRALHGKNPETTLVVVVSKTFTTAETMLNARTVREWIKLSLGPEAVRTHMVAVSTNLEAVAKFGLDPDNAFGFWDWVGGRYSVTSAVGLLPLALQYGFPLMERFLAGARSVDRHFASAPLKDNLPVLMGLLGVWNSSFLGCSATAILPYCQALSKLAPHMQQVGMESNGKGVALDGTPVNFDTGEVLFGEPGTNGQHSFYQLIHQGRVVPCEFVGAAVGQQAVYLDGEAVSNHDELMSNYFAQADALAYGKTGEELRKEGVPEHLIPHKTFTGNRPSLSLLLPCVGPYQVGQILSLYEHKIAVQGFVWGINSFDQWGVELGKVLAGQVRKTISNVRKDGQTAKDALGAAGFNYSTSRLMSAYLEQIQSQRQGLSYSEVFKSPFQDFCATAVRHSALPRDPLSRTDLISTLGRVRGPGSEVEDGGAHHEQRMRSKALLATMRYNSLTHSRRRERPVCEPLGLECCLQALLHRHAARLLQALQQAVRAARDCQASRQLLRPGGHHSLQSRHPFRPGDVPTTPGRHQRRRLSHSRARCLHISLESRHEAGRQVGHRAGGHSRGAGMCHALLHHLSIRRRRGRAHEGQPGAPVRRDALTHERHAGVKGTAGGRLGVAWRWAAAVWPALQASHDEACHLRGYTHLACGSQGAVGGQDAVGAAVPGGCSQQYVVHALRVAQPHLGGHHKRLQGRLPLTVGAAGLGHQAADLVAEASQPAGVGSRQVELLARRQRRAGILRRRHQLQQMHKGAAGWGKHRA